MDLIKNRNRPESPLKVVFHFLGVQSRERNPSAGKRCFCVEKDPPKAPDRSKAEEPDPQCGLQSLQPDRPYLPGSSYLLGGNPFGIGVQNDLYLNDLFDFLKAPNIISSAFVSLDLPETPFNFADKKPFTFSITKNCGHILSMYPHKIHK